jgi:2-polyprenyl-6-methoxyphenol hydroxylase-like FAD-dependent oxidoreductase
LKIVITGAGVAGLSTAIALKQKGFDAEIYERHPQRTEIGAGIVCWPNASFVLQELGMLDDIAKVSGQPIKMQRRSEIGEDLGALDILSLNQAMGYPSFSILRRDLMAILERQAIRSGVKIHYGCNIEQITTGETGLAELELSNGERIQADLIVGADGRMNSQARTYVNGCNKPVYQGFINWIGVFDSTDTVFSEQAVTDFWGVGKRFGIVPITDKLAYWAGAVAAPLSPPISKPASNSMSVSNTGAGPAFTPSLDERNPDHYKSDLKALFADWPDPINTLIDHTPTSALNKVYVHDHEPINTWHKDNVLLIGDSAHAPLPTSGQGACQALEDAWHLARLLSESYENLEQVMEDFTQLRLPKNTGIAQGARHLARSLFNTDPAYCQERNRMSQETDFLASVSGMAKGWGNGLPL